MWGCTGKIQFADGFSGGIEEGDVVNITVAKDDAA